MVISILIEFVTFILYIIFVLKYISVSKKRQNYLDDVIQAGCVPSKKNNNRIIHINCKVDENVIHYVPKEFNSNIYSFNGIFFETNVEMFQWVEKAGVFGIKHTGVFLDYLNRNKLLYHRNPVFIPSVKGSNRVYANPIQIGKYIVDAQWFTQLERKRKLEPIDDEWYQKSESRPNLEVNHLNTQVFNNALYTGDPLNPLVGDLRIRFYGSEEVYFSIIGRQTSSILNKEYQIKPIKFQGREIVLMAGGTLDKIQLQDYQFNQLYNGRNRGIEVALLVLLTLLYLNVKIEMGKVCRITCSVCMAGITVNLTKVVISPFYGVKFLIKPILSGILLLFVMIISWKIDRIVSGIKSGKIDLGENFDSGIWNAESRTISLESNGVI